jgi:hypothetical protein
MAELTGRSPMKSPGRPSTRREVERLFWREIAKGLTSEAGGAHQACHPPAAAAGAVTFEDGMDARGAVGAARGRMDDGDLVGEFGVADRAGPGVPVRRA